MKQDDSSLADLSTQTLPPKDKHCYPLQIKIWRD